MTDKKETKLRPIGDNVLLFQYTQKETTSGIVFANQHQDKEVKTICVVSALGPEVKSDLNLGDFVIIPRRTGTWVPFEGDRYVLVKEEEILAIIDGLKAYDKREVDFNEFE